MGTDQWTNLWKKKTVTDDSRESEGFAALSKSRKLFKDDELQEPEGTGKSLSASVVRVETTQCFVLFSLSRKIQIRITCVCTANFVL
jgi:hypothetical protein